MKEENDSPKIRDLLRQAHAYHDKPILFLACRVKHTLTETSARYTASLAILCLWGLGLLYTNYMCIVFEGFQYVR